MVIHSQILRLPLNVDKSNEPPQDSVTNSKPRFWNRTSLEFQIGAFYNDAVLDVSDFDSITLAIKPTSLRTGASLMSKTVPSSDIDTTLNSDTWNDGTKQHASIKFDKTETSLALTSDDTDFWMVASAVVNAANAGVITASTLTHTLAVATFTATGAHGYSDGDVVTITGATPTTYNGQYLVTKVSSTVFTYTMASTPGSDATGTIHATVNYRSVVLAAGEITVSESGYEDDPPSAVVEPIYFTAAQSDARYVLSLDLSTIETDVATALSQSASAQSDAATAITTANSAMPIAGGTFSGDVTMASGKNLILSTSTPSNALYAASRGYVDAQLSGAFVPLNGATQMTGMLLLVATDPTLDNHAVRRKYITDNYIIKTGATAMTGELTLSSSGTPSGATIAAPKGYVDARETSIIGGAVSGLNTLGKIATSLNNDTTFNTTMGTALAAKVSKDGSTTMTGHLTLYTGTTPTSASAISRTYGDSAYARLDGTTTMTAHLPLFNSDGTMSSSSATRKAYVDAQDALKSSLTGAAFTGPITFSGSTNYGVRLANFASSSYPSGPAVGGLIFDTTSANLVVWTGSTWKTIGGSGGAAASWFDGSGTPGGGTGIDGDFYVETQDDDDEGIIWKKVTGSWSVIVGGRLPLRGGTMTGALLFSNGLDPAIYWTLEGYSTRCIYDGSSGYNYEITGAGVGGPAFFQVKHTGNVNIATGSLEIAGTKVVTTQQTSISDAPFTLVGVQGQLNALLAACRAHGLIAT